MLPLVDELCLMSVSVLVFACVLFLAVAAIMFLGEEYNAFQVGAILISGKLPEWVFKTLIKEECFIDDEKIEKQKMVKQAVAAWYETNPAVEVTNPAEVSGRNQRHELYQHLSCCGTASPVPSSLLNVIAGVVTLYFVLVLHYKAISREILGCGQRFTCLHQF